MIGIAILKINELSPHRDLNPEQLQSIPVQLMSSGFDRDVHPNPTKLDRENGLFPSSLVLKVSLLLSKG